MNDSRLEADRAVGPRSTGWREKRSLQRAAALLTIIGVSLALAQWARPVLMPLALALLMHLALVPLVRGMKRLHISAPFGGLIVVLGIAAGSLAAIYQLTPTVLEWTKKAPEAFANVERRLQALREPLQDIVEASASVEKIGGAAQAVKVEVLDASVTTLLLERVGSIGAFAALTLMLLYFLLASDGAFLRNLVRASPRLRDKRRAVEMMRRLEQDVSRYLSTLLGMSALVGVAEGLAMYALGMPNAILWGLMAMVLNWAPYVGAGLGTVVVALVASTVFNSTAAVLAPPLVFLLITSLEGSLITPAVLGRRLKLNPVVVLVWVALWGWIWGLMGAFVAAPMLAALRIVSSNVDELRPLAEVLGIGDSTERGANVESDEHEAQAPQVEPL